VSMPVPFQPRRPLGPPPPPLQPRIQETQHVVHAIATFFTCGLWLPFWVLVAVLNSNRNARIQYAYEQQYLAWQRAYWEWQHGG
jgi:FtsH-binding integral membrane protein